MGNLSFDYATIKISDITVDTTPVPNHPHRKTVNHVVINDEMLLPSERFWHSLCSRFSEFGITKNIYHLFDYDEIFDRLSQRSPNDRVRITIQRESGAHAPVLLAAVSPEKPQITYDGLMDLLIRFGGQHITYSDGMLTSWHEPRIGGHRYSVECPHAGIRDEFENRFMLEVPIDSYGKPCVFPSVERVKDATRWVTRNATSLKNEISLGKGLDVVHHAVSRVLDSFNSDEGYATLRNRVEMSLRSWCSVYEANEAYKMITRLMSNSLITGQNKETVQVGGGLIARFHKLTGDTSSIYGFATLDTLAAKKQRGLPVNCTVYDLLGFLAEVATYDARIEGAKALHGMIGMLMGDAAGYDLEGMRDKYPNFSDFRVHTSLRDVVEGRVSLTE